MKTTKTTQEKDTLLFYSPYFDTEMYVKMFEKQGYRIICIAYGYTNFQDLIIYEEVEK